MKLNLFKSKRNMNPFYWIKYHGLIGCGYVLWNKVTGKKEDAPE